MYLGIDPIEKGSLCIITSRGVFFKHYNGDRKWFARTIDKAISSQSRLDNAYNAPVVAVVRGVRMTKVGEDLYPASVLARAIHIERVASILQARFIPSSTESIYDVAYDLGINRKWYEDGLNRKKIAYQLMDMNARMFSNVDDASIERHAISGLMALYCEKYSNQKMMFVN